MTDLVDQPVQGFRASDFKRTRAADILFTPSSVLHWCFGGPKNTDSRWCTGGPPYFHHPHCINGSCMTIVREIVPESPILLVLAESVAL